MTTPHDTALAVLRALTDARERGDVPLAIVMDEVTRRGLEDAEIGFWATGRGRWALFNVPVEVDGVAGWRVRTRGD